MLFSILELIRSLTFFTTSYSNNVFPEPLSKEEEEKYITLLLNKDPKARDKLIEHNLRLVAHIVKKYENSNTDTDDLISIGTIGLIKGIDSYSLKHATKITTYCARCIENEILMCIRSTKKIKAEVSLNVPIGIDNDGNSISFDDILGTDPDDILNSLSLKIQVSQLLRSLDKVLTDREKQIVLMRYGIKGCEAKTQREIAAELGISRSYVSRIEKKALQKLKDYLKVSAI